MTDNQENNFALKKPCVNCPFTKANGKNFGLGRHRLHDIAGASAFPCHKTVDYDETTRTGQQSFTKGGPMQCAGLMALLDDIGKPNEIMRAGAEFGYFDPTELNKTDTYATLEEAIEAHEAWI